VRTTAPPSLRRPPVEPEQDSGEGRSRTGHGSQRARRPRSQPPGLFSLRRSRPSRRSGRWHRQWTGRVCTPARTSPGTRGAPAPRYALRPRQGGPQTAPPLAGSRRPPLPMRCRSRSRRRRSRGCAVLADARPERSRPSGRARPQSDTSRPGPTSACGRERLRRHRWSERCRGRRCGWPQPRTLVPGSVTSTTRGASSGMVERLGRTDS
jgi:hypothetical protein